MSKPELTKICEHCKEIIQSESVFCEYCQQSVRNYKDDIILKFQIALGVFILSITLFVLFGGLDIIGILVKNLLIFLVLGFIALGIILSIK